MSLPFSAFAAGLGKLTVLSNLGEPLKAEIEVVAVEKGERDSLSARLAAVEAYLQANLPFPNGAWGLRVSMETRPSGEPYVSISSKNPVSEPFVDVLVDLRWNGGRLMRSYTALLDPPAYNAPETVPPATPAETASKPASQPAQTAEVAPAAVPAAPQGLSEPSTAEAPLAAEPATGTPESKPAAAMKDAEMAEPAAAPAPAPTAKSAPQADTAASAPATREVKRGDTLGKIAREVKPADLTLDQMLVLLYRTNPEAFAGKNMNRLKTGKILRIPGNEDAAGLSAGDASKQVKIQSADWNAWREKIAGGVESTPAVPETSQSASGAITAKVEEKPAAPAEQPKEVLKLSKGETKGENKGDAKAGGKGADRMSALEEDLAASGKAATEAKERAAKLEKTIKDMQSLTELKSKNLAAAEQAAKDAKQGKDAKAGVAATESGAHAPAAEGGKPAVTAALPPEAKGDAHAVAKPEPAHAADAAPAVTPPATPAGEPVAAAPAAAPAPVEQAAKPAKPKKPVKAASKPEPEPSMVDTLLGEPMYLAGGAGVLALLGLGGFMAWRKRKAAAAGDSVESEGVPEDDVPPSSEAADADEAPVAEESAPVSAQKSADEHVSEEVDPIAEADVYLAYGRDTQAEQILKDAIQSQPQRQEIYTKLLEVYHKRKDVVAFGAVAQALQGVSGGSGEHWDRAVRMGYQIDSTNPLYAAGAGAGPMDSDVTASGSIDKGLDLDLGLGQGEAGTSTDIDLGDLTLNSDRADLDLSALSGSADAADLDLRTQVLGNTQQADLGKTMDASARTQQISAGDLTAELGRTQEGKTAAKDGLDFDLDLSTITGAGQKSEPSGLDLDVGTLSLDGQLSGKSEPRMSGGATLPDVDLSKISLDLDTTSPGAEAASNGKDEHWHDVQTKFDLAKAYQEMGDKEGAREILREVVAEGDDDQKNAAQKVLEALA